MPGYYDPQGNPLELMEWAELFEQRQETPPDAPESWWRKQTKVDDVVVSTVWLGIDHNWWGHGPPLIWETMIFGNSPWNDHQWRYPTRETAWDDHERIVRALRAGEDPETYKDNLLGVRPNGWPDSNDRPT